MNDFRRYTPEKIKSLHSILLVEDNEDDIFLIKRAFSKLGVSFSASFVQDGQEAIEYLSETDKTQYPVPRWIITDIKMPRVGGLEFARWMKRSDLHHVPIIIVSSSSQRQDVLDAYKAGACGYFVKPSHFDEMLEMWKTVSSYWSKATLIDFSAPGGKRTV